MISSNGLIIIEMVSSETVDRGTVLFILKGEVKDAENKNRMHLGAVYG